MNLRFLRLSAKMCVVHQHAPATAGPLLATQPPRHLPNPRPSRPPQSLPRPFTKLRNLDLAEVAEKVAADLQGTAEEAEPAAAEEAAAVKEEVEARQGEEEVDEQPKAKKARGREGRK